MGPQPRSPMLALEAIEYAFGSLSLLALLGCTHGCTEDKRKAEGRGRACIIQRKRRSGERRSGERRLRLRAEK